MTHSNTANQAMTHLSRHSRAMLLNVLWHHQGGSSAAGQAIRAMLGIGQHDYLTDEQVGEAKWIDSLLAAQPSQAHAADFEEYRRGLREAFDLANMIDAGRNRENADLKCTEIVRALASRANGDPSLPMAERESAAIAQAQAGEAVAFTDAQTLARLKVNPNSDYSVWGSACEGYDIPLYTHPNATESDRKDAERYRWLRGEHFPTADKPPLAQVVWKAFDDRHSSDWANMIDGRDLDRAIDAALSQQPASGE